MNARSCGAACGAGVLLTVCLIGPAVAGTVSMTQSDADRHFKPGDVIFRINEGNPSKTELAIIAGQKILRAKTIPAIKAAVVAGDVNTVHAMIYVGGGLTAEASGGAKKVVLRGLGHQYHAGRANRLEVYRSADTGFVARVLAVAKKWATERMGYGVAAGVALDASYGDKARQEALVFARAAGKRGGPSSVAKMFCSQFVIAVLQAAALAPAVEKNKSLTTRQVRLPSALEAHASRATPMHVLGLIRLATAKKQWSKVGTFRLTSGD